MLRMYDGVLGVPLGLNGCDLSIDDFLILLVRTKACG